MLAHLPGAFSTLYRIPFLTILIALVAVSVCRSQIRDEPTREHVAWLDEVDPLITTAEAQAFSGLARHYQRDAFIRRFWQERNGFRSEWKRRRELAAELFEDLDGDRARTLLLLGAPEMMMTDLCPELARSVEAWYYGRSAAFEDGFYLFFVPGPDEGSESVHWLAEDGVESLFRPEALAATNLHSLLPQLYRRCGHGREMSIAVSNAVDWVELQEQRQLFPPVPDDWVREFADRLTDPAIELPPLQAELQVTFPGRVQEKTVVQVELDLPVDVATPTDGDNPELHLQMDGELLRQNHLYDQFRYRFDLPLAAIADDATPVVFQRYLLPGEYQLILRLEDRHSGRNYRTEGLIHVPNPERSTPTPHNPLAEANAVLTAADSWVKIEPLTEELLTGKVRVQAQVRGEAVVRVTFVLNGKPVMSKTRPPFGMEIDLGRSPRLHTLEAVAYDAAGRELARDLVPINAGPHRFDIRLLEPRSGQAYVQSLRAAAEVDLPAGETIERVDFYLNETRLASLYQPPFAQPILLPQNRRITYVRAVAYLEDGNATEDLVFINAPRDMGHLNINMVELYTTVTDKKGRPVAGLAREAFSVREEGQPQELRRFELVQDLSIHAGVVLDASTSMQEELEDAIDSAVGFFARVIEPKDRAAAVVFNDEPILMASFTNDIEALSAGLDEVESEGETALYDTLVFTLHYFSGIRGKRALILLSDGEDSSSRFPFDETLEFAQRSGVAIYTIALGLDRRRIDTRNVLTRLAGGTGGRFFSISSTTELAAIYEVIEQELRSQYLLVYQSSHEEGGDFRRVAVEVEGLKARTIPGYYP